jgi:hypothetical protein
MEFNEVVEKFQHLVIEHGLPKTDMALFGIKCPYCGKSDRIRQLEDPEELGAGIEPEEMKIYSDYWKNLTQAGGSIGVCKFCQNPLKIYLKEGKAEGLYK